MCANLSRIARLKPHPPNKSAINRSHPSKPSRASCGPVGLGSTALGPMLFTLKKPIQHSPFARVIVHTNFPTPTGATRQLKQSAHSHLIPNRPCAALALLPRIKRVSNAVRGLFVSRPNPSKNRKSAQVGVCSCSISDVSSNQGRIISTHSQVSR